MVPKYSNHEITLKGQVIVLGVDLVARAGDKIIIVNSLVIGHIPRGFTQKIAPAALMGIEEPDNETDVAEAKVFVPKALAKKILPRKPRSVTRKEKAVFTEAVLEVLRQEGKEINAFTIGARLHIPSQNRAKRARLGALLKTLLADGYIRRTNLENPTNPFYVINEKEQDYGPGPKLKAG